MIKIEPTNPEVVYVPTYNPTVVYGAWPYPAYPPYAYYPPGYVAGGALLAAVGAFVIAAPERNSGPVFIEGSKPVTEDQVRQKLVADGWTNVQVVRRGRLVMAMASKDGRTDAFMVDALTGRLRKDADDDDDD